MQAKNQEIIERQLQEMEAQKQYYAKIEEENRKYRSQMNDFKQVKTELQTNLMQNEQIRKIQQQQILSLKGNMRVFCRVKPLDDQFEAAQTEQVFSFPQMVLMEKSKEKVQNHTIELTNPKSGYSKHIYNYDGVFMPNQGQADIFDEITPFIQSALDGTNVCIFAYG